MPKTSPNKFIFFYLKLAAKPLRKRSNRKAIRAFDISTHRWSWRWTGHGNCPASWSPKRRYTEPERYISQGFQDLHLVCFLRLRRETVESSREEFRTMKHRSSGYILQLLKHRRSSNANCKVWISMWKRNRNTNPIWACCWKVIYIRMIKYKNKCIGNECNRVSNSIFLFWNFVCIAFNVHAIVWESKIYCTRELGHAQNLKPSHVYLTN